MRSCVKVFNLSVYFCVWCKIKVQFHSFLSGYLASPISLFILHSWHSFEDQLKYMWGFISILITEALFLKSGYIKLPTLLIFLEIALFVVFCDYTWTSEFFSISVKNAIGILIGIIIQSLAHFGQYGHFYNIKSSNPWMWDIFLFVYVM